MRQEVILRVFLKSKQACLYSPPLSEYANEARVRAISDKAAAGYVPGISFFFLSLITM